MTPVNYGRKDSRIQPSFENGISPGMEPNRYQSFLLRMWVDNEGRQFIMLERVTEPNQRFYFPSLDDLFLFLIDPERGALGASDGDFETES